MPSTIFARDQRRARRWLEHCGGMSDVTAAAWELLVVRLPCRARASRVLILPALFGFAVFAGSAWEVVSGQPQEATFQRRFAAQCVTILVVTALAKVVSGEVAARRERRISAGLSHRVSRNHAVTLRVVLGPVRSAFLLTTISLQAVLAVAVPFAHAGWVAWAYPAAFIVTVGVVLLGITRNVNRGSIAVDAASLAIDERLQAQDVFSATAPLIMLGIAFYGTSLAVSPASWLAPLSFVSFAVIQVLWIWASARNPWRPLPATRPRPATHPLPTSVGKPLWR